MRAYKTKSHRHRSNIIPYTKPKYPNVIPDCIGLRLRYKYIFLLFPYPNPQPLAIINFHDWLDFFFADFQQIFFLTNTYFQIHLIQQKNEACMHNVFIQNSKTRGKNEGAKSQKDFAFTKLSARQYFSTLRKKKIPKNPLQKKCILLSVSRPTNTQYTKRIKKTT